MKIDAQNERTDAGNRHRSRRSRGNRRKEQPLTMEAELAQVTPAAQAPDPIADAPAAFTRPADLAPPEEKVDMYCVHHSPALPLQAPIEYRRDMTTLRHLAVDRFGAATLYCDCVHDGPHEWPPSLQTLETAIELDQFLMDSTNEA